MLDLVSIKPSSFLLRSLKCFQNFAVTLQWADIHLCIICKNEIMTFLNWFWVLFSLLPLANSQRNLYARNCIYDLKCLNFACISFTLLLYWYYTVTISITFVSGKIMKELRDPGRRPCWSAVHDMAVDGDTVIITRCDENKILYYRLIFE